MLSGIFRPLEEQLGDLDRHCDECGDFIANEEYQECEGLCYDCLNEEIKEQMDEREHPDDKS